MLSISSIAVIAPSDAETHFVNVVDEDLSPSHFFDGQKSVQILEHVTLVNDQVETDMLRTCISRERSTFFTLQCEHDEIASNLTNRAQNSEIVRSTIIEDHEGVKDHMRFA